MNIVIGELNVKRNVSEPVNLEGKRLSIIGIKQ